ncbi:hypothetical protein M514_08146 [Trichuris suis]|uniref:Mos1 transposase HTH domain-containing protein n=1 Tax=Trichuris suis TaxID=68888 RepID=A0A085NQZ3_9BILA|nr:hypothetical protein M513_08146 [Trichuris suis]KFD71889.1 hypothetical protein M514_08146 [Trichuris suis]
MKLLHLRVLFLYEFQERVSAAEAYQNIVERYGMDVRMRLPESLLSVSKESFLWAIRMSKRSGVEKKVSIENLVSKEVVGEEPARSSRGLALRFRASDQRAARHL